MGEGGPYIQTTDNSKSIAFMYSLEFTTVCRTSLQIINPEYKYLTESLLFWKGTRKSCTSQIEKKIHLGNKLFYFVSCFFFFTKTSFSSSRNKFSGLSSLLCRSCFNSAALILIVRDGWAPSTSMRPLSSPQHPCKGHTQVKLESREICKDASKLAQIFKTAAIFLSMFWFLHQYKWQDLRI